LDSSCTLWYQFILWVKLLLNTIILLNK
jgi:hypothetical protein